MRIYLLTNDEPRPRHIQVRDGEINDVESNPLMFDGVLAPGEGTRLFCHAKFSFSRSRYVDTDDAAFSEWICLRDGSARPMTIAEKRAYSETKIREMIKAFEARTLPEEQFTHDAHIIVACWYLFRNRKQDAFDTVIQHIIAYKAAHETDNSKAFHQTLTRFWLMVVREFIEAYTPAAVEIAVNTLLTTELSEKTLPFHFYSRERLFSSAAIQDWVEPDLKSLDELLKMVRSLNGPVTY